MDRATYFTSFIKSTTCWNAISSRLANWARTLRFKHIFELLKEKRKSLYLIPCDRTAALILVIQRLLKSRRRWSRSRWEAESAFKACWFAVRKRVEEEPRNPFAIFKILFRRLRATFPRFTRVILLLDIYCKGSSLFDPVKRQGLAKRDQSSIFRRWDFLLKSRNRLYPSFHFRWRIEGLVSSN